MNTTLAAIVIALTAFGAACGGSEGSSDVGRLAVTGNPEVAALLGTPLTESDIEAEQKAVFERSEALVASCMAEAGFDYIPEPFSVGSAGNVLTDTSFGVADRFFAPYSDDYEPPAQDPNFEVLESLSDDERAAYGAALNGLAADFDPRFDSLETIQESIQEGAANRSGCRAEAIAIAIAETDRNPVLIDDYQRLRAGMINTDQRMIRAQVDWATCMAEAGFPYNNSAAIVDDLERNAVEALTETIDRGIELVPGESPPSEAVELIDAVYERERSAAEANAKCRGPMDKALAEISNDVDAVFLDRNS